MQIIRFLSRSYPARFFFLWQNFHRLKITVNGELATTETIIKSSDRIQVPNHAELVVTSECLKKAEIYQAG